MRTIKQSGLRPIVFLMVSSTDHINGITGRTVTVTLSKDGGAFAAAAGAVAEIGNGWYKLTPTAADSGTLGSLVLHATATGADPVDEKYQVVAYDPEDAGALGLSRVDAAISSRLSTAGYTAPDNATISSIYGVVDTEVAAIKAKTDNLPADPADASDIAGAFAAVTAAIPSANANADALLDRANGVETGLTLRQWLRLGGSVLFGKASGLDTNAPKYRDFADTKNRISATTDAFGNRSAVTRDAT